MNKYTMSCRQSSQGPPTTPAVFPSLGIAALTQRATSEQGRVRSLSSALPSRLFEFEMISPIFFEIMYVACNEISY
jgi:hypothetical protein